MSLVALSALPSSATVASGDIMAFVISGTTKKMTAGTFRTQLFAFAANDPLNTGVLTTVGNSTITGSLAGVTTLSCTTLNVAGNQIAGGTLAVAGLFTLAVPPIFNSTTGYMSISFQYSGATKAYIGTDRANALMTGSADGDLILATTGTAIDFCTNSGASIALQITTGGTLKFIPAVSKMIPGATSFSHRNNADSADNFILTDAGNATLRGSLSFATAAGKIIPGGTSLSWRNNADTNDNLIITDAGVATFRSQVNVTSGGIWAPTNGATNASINLPHSAGDPSVTITNGDVWTTTAGIFTKINGAKKFIQFAASKVVGDQVTGYTNAWTGGAANRATSYDATTITLPQLAARVRALQNDMESHGLIGV